MRVDNDAKIEGIFAQVHGSIAHIQMVTDADDPNVPAALYEAAFEL
jgi:hypothetical protein